MSNDAGDRGALRVGIKIPESVAKMLGVPNVNRKLVTSSMDIPARDLVAAIQRSQGDPPTLEVLHDGADYSLIVPQRIIIPVANYVDGAFSTSNVGNPRLIWEIPSGDGTDGVKDYLGKKIKEIIDKADEGYGDDEDKPSGQKIRKPSDEDYGTYDGPKWTIPQEKKNVPASGVSNDFGTTTTVQVTGTDTDDSRIPYIEQSAIFHDIWWVATTTKMNPDKKPNVPFALKFEPRQPKSKALKAFFAIRINRNAADGKQKDDSFDIIFSEDMPPIIYDWNCGETSGEGTSSAFEVIKWDLNLVNGQPPKTGIRWDGENTISVLCCGGRLWIDILETQCRYCYTRVATQSTSDGTGGTNSADTSTGGDEYKTKYINIQIDELTVIAGACSAKLNVSAIAFSEAMVDTQFPAAPDDSLPPKYNNEYFSSPGGDCISARDGNEKKKLYIQPYNTDGSSSNITGATASKFNGESVSSGDPMGSDLLGDANFYGKIKAEAKDNAAASGKTYVVNMVAEDVKFGDGDTSVPGLPPVYHRIRGAYANDPSEEAQFSLVDKSDDLISFSESLSSPDGNHIVHSLDVVLYNEEGTYDYLLSKVVPIRLSYEWDDVGGSSSGSSEYIFTGLVLSGSVSETAGKETISLHCEDYMYILESVILLNSPYYDGMETFTAIADIATRAGITAIDDTGETKSFLAAGSFVSPKHRYGSRSSLKECILKICSTYELVIYFDGDGKLHVDNIQGGQWFDVAGDITASHEFFKDPEKAWNEIVLSEKTTTISAKSSVTSINIKTIDASMNATMSGEWGGIIFARDDSPLEDAILPFRKILFVDNAMIGSKTAAQNLLEMYKARMYKPTYGISIHTVSDKVIKPFEFMSVDDDIYRIVSVSRSYSAEDNSFMTDISGTWMGAR